MEFLPLRRGRSSARKVPGGEERGETAVFEGYVGSCQPRSRSSSAISDVTSPVQLVGKIRRGLSHYGSIALGSKPPQVTRMARTGLGTRLGSCR